MPMQLNHTSGRNKNRLGKKGRFFRENKLRRGFEQDHACIPQPQDWFGSRLQITRIGSAIVCCDPDLQTRRPGRRWVSARYSPCPGPSHRSAEKLLQPHVIPAQSRECLALPTRARYMANSELAQPSECAASNRRLEKPTLAARRPQKQALTLVHKMPGTGSGWQWPKTTQVCQGASFVWHVIGAHTLIELQQSKLPVQPR